MRTVAIIQARMGSSRLPGKVLRDLNGQPMLSWVVHRVQRALTVNAVVIATTTEPLDDPLAEFCQEQGWACYRGSEFDVLDRYYQAALGQRAEAIVRVTGDCPLIDPAVIDRVVIDFQAQQPGTDYAANILPRRTFPRGLDTEVFRFDSLECIWRETTDPNHREHVTSFFYRSPGRFKTLGVANDVDYSDKRWTVDTDDDLQLARDILEHFGHEQFSWRDALAACAEHPEWEEVNRHVQQKAF